MCYHLKSRYWIIFQKILKKTPKKCSGFSVPESLLKRSLPPREASRRWARWVFLELNLEGNLTVNKSCLLLCKFLREDNSFFRLCKGVVKCEILLLYTDENFVIFLGYSLWWYIILWNDKFDAIILQTKN